MPTKLFLFILILILGGNVCHAQWEKDYIPLPTKSARLDSIKAVLKEQHAQRIAKIDEKKQKLLFEAYSERFENANYKASSDNILTANKINGYLDRLICLYPNRIHCTQKAEVLEKNTEMPKGKLPPQFNCTLDFKQNLLLFEVNKIRYHFLWENSILDKIDYERYAGLGGYNVIGMLQASTSPMTCTSAGSQKVNSSHKSNPSEVFPSNLNA